MSLENVTANVSTFAFLYDLFNKTSEVALDVLQNGTDTTSAQMDLIGDIYKLAISGTTGAILTAVLAIIAFLYYCLAVKRVKVRFFRQCEINQQQQQQQQQPSPTPSVLNNNDATTTTK